MKKIGLVLTCLMLFSCTIRQGKNEDILLVKASFSDLKNFENDRFEEIVPTFVLSCDALKKNPNNLSKAKIEINSKDQLAVCEKFEKLVQKDEATVKNFIKDHFTPYLVTYKEKAEGQFTSYYEAELKASKTKHGKYQYPIYGRPKDLIEINLRDFDKSLPDKRILGRVEKNKFVPYYTREQIEKDGLDAPVILWGDDKVDIFLMQIQGSAVALLDDGTSLRVSYADNNGHQFVGIGSVLLKKGLLKKGEASMDKIRDWLKKNPEMAEINMNENPRFIFHKISDANGPIGALGVPLTAGRSLAVDPLYIPLSSLLFLETKTPDGQELNKLVSAQDIGAAIKGPIRGDYFWGHGEQALLEAGRMNSIGQFYILMPNK